MQYDHIIIDLMNRIISLETRCDVMEKQLADLDIIQEPTAPQPAATGRQHMTPENIRACYNCGVALFQSDSADFGAEIDQLVAETQMNRNSAIMYVYAVKNMLAGEVYKRAISQTATELFFQYIAEDFGTEKLKAAIRATRAHIAYRRRLGHTVDGLEVLCDKYEGRGHN